MGTPQVDTAALDAQVQERRQREARERAEARAAALAAEMLDSRVVAEAQRAAQARADQERVVDAFRHEQQVSLRMTGAAPGLLAA